MPGSASADNSGPRASRPYMPGYQIAAAEGGKGLLPWSWAAERLSNAHNYWLSTTRPDGGPHAMAVWGVWLDESFIFSTAQSSTKARNLAADPRCVVCPERGDEAVVLEGVAEEVTDPALLRRFADAYNTKYDWDMDAAAGGIYAVRPSVAFGFIELPGDFPTTATRWTFNDVAEG